MTPACCDRSPPTCSTAGATISTALKTSCAPTTSWCAAKPPGCWASPWPAWAAPRPNTGASFFPRPPAQKPFPDAAAVASAQRLERLAQGIGALEALIQQQPVPENDRMTQRYRQEAPTLKTLIHSMSSWWASATCCDPWSAEQGAPSILARCRIWRADWKPFEPPCKVAKPSCSTARGEETKLGSPGATLPAAG